MGHQEHPMRTVHDTARTIMGQLKVTYSYTRGQSEADDPNYPKMLWDEHGEKLVAHLYRFGVEARGKIIDAGIPPDDPSGNCSFHEVANCAELVHKQERGKAIATYLAAYVIVAAMVDIIRANVRNLRDEELKRIYALDQSDAA